MNLTEQLQLLTQTFIEKDAEYRYLSGTGRLELEALFMTKLGNLKLDLLNLQLEIKALQRKTEEFIAAINRKEKPSLASINAKILIEMTEAREELMKQKEMVTAAGDFLQNLKPIANPVELKEVYRRLAKKLHPDVIKEPNETLQDVWLRVREAYTAGDLDALKAIEIVYADVFNSIEEIDQNDEQLLKDKTEQLKSSIQMLDEKTAALRKTFPYSIENLLRDEELLACEREKIEAEISQHEEYHQELIAKFDQLIKDHGG